MNNQTPDIANPWLWLLGLVLIIGSWAVVLYILLDIIEPVVRTLTLTR